jgi:ammonium transporter, Amt family
MTTRKPTRGGLAALIFGLLIAVFVGAQFFAATYVHAQAPAPAAAAEPAAPAAASEAPPACDAKMQINCTPNSGDTAWMLTSVALVLMMTIPGLGLFYGGMVRKKNVGDTVMTSFAVTCLDLHLLDGVRRRHAEYEMYYSG